MPAAPCCCVVSLLSVIRALKRWLGESASPEGLIASFRTREVADWPFRAQLHDGLVRYRFGENAELMGAWASARNVEGPFRSKAEPPAGSVTPAIIKPAA